MGKGISTQDKGKYAEFLVFAELIGRGADVYTPTVDTGIDAVVRRKNGSYTEVQIKATEEDDQAGYFNVPNFDRYKSENFYVVCVDLNDYPLAKRAKPSYKSLTLPDGKLPNVWILTSKEFEEYETAGHRLPIYEGSQKHRNEKRYILLKKAYRAWERLTEG